MARTKDPPHTVATVTSGLPIASFSSPGSAVPRVRPGTTGMYSSCWSGRVGS
jgi:hypothetical protein